MRIINTQNHTIKTSQGEFTPEETRSTRLHNIGEGAKDVGRKVLPYAAGLGKSLWDIAQYAGRGYLPFDVGKDIHRLWTAKDYDGLDEQLKGFKKILDETVDVPGNEIEHKEIRDLVSGDTDLYHKAYDKLKKKLRLDDKELGKILDKWITARRIRGHIDEFP